MDANDLIMNSIIHKLDKAADAYYNGKEIMSDKDYDSMLASLQKLEKESGKILPNSPTNKVGAPVPSTLAKFEHTVPALSLDKTKDTDVFIGKFKKGIKDLRTDNDKVVLMYKEDGSTIQCYYKDGKLDKAVTRGDGHIGSVITHNASSIIGIPKTIPVKGTIIVRGEALISYEDFKAINDKLDDDNKFKNPRNLASASITMLDPNEVKKRKVHFVAFNLVHYEPKMERDYLAGMYIPTGSNYLDREAWYDRLTFSGRFRILSALGFDLVPYIISPVDELRNNMIEMTNFVNDYQYPVDGLVAALDDYESTYELPGTEHHPNILLGYAFKWADDTHKTVLRDIEWSPSRTGLFNPVAIFDPVEIDGTTVSRASLHNLTYILDKRLIIGDTITVYKANLVIPQVDQNVTFDSIEGDKINEINRRTSLIYKQVPKKCPSCGSDIVLDNSNDVKTLYCINDNCPEKIIGKLAHFCSRECMDIQGMSEETIKKLMDAGYIVEYADLFDLYNKPGIATLPGFGKQSWTKLCDAAGKARSTDFIHFLTALSIPNIGKGQAKALYNYLSDNYDRLCKEYNFVSDKFMPFELLVELVEHGYNFASIDGFGDIIASGLTKWMKAKFSTDISTPEWRVYSIIELTDSKSESSNISSSISGKSFCITGKLETFNNRQELVAKIESLGGKWVDSVSNKTDYLINNDINSTSGKNKKANQLNIPIISERDFLALIEQN